MKVLVALSGGVDSAVAAARVVEAGHQVTAVHMRLEKDAVSAAAARARSCSSPEDLADAQRIAEQLGIELQVWDLAEEFKRIVMQDFLNAYRQGLTPNPCVRCNQYVKFAALTERAFALGFDAVATGHYAHVQGGSGAPAQLHRARYLAKDQSYVLAVMGRETLERVMFPLGQIESKEAVRAEAGARGFAVANKPDSFDICFIPDGDTQGFLQRNLGQSPGEVVDLEGKVVGEHRGYYNFTIGQRKGLGTPGPAPDGQPRYVVRTEPEANRVVIGRRQDLEINTIEAAEPVWMSEPAESLTGVEVQFRAHGRALPARVEVNGAGLQAHLEEAAFGVAPGQSLVVYRGSQVLAQANITGTRLARSQVDNVN